MQGLNLLVSSFSGIYNPSYGTCIIFSFLFRWRIHQTHTFPWRISWGMFMSWQSFSSWPLSCRGHSCRPPTMWLQRLASTSGVLYWWADLPGDSLITAPALCFHLSHSLSEDQAWNDGFREDMCCIFIQKAGQNSAGKLLAAIPFAKN